MITYKYDIDMTSGGKPLEIPLKQYDTDFEIQFSLIDRKGIMVLESGTTVKIRGTKPDGYGYSVDATLDIVNKTVTVEGDEQMTIVAGKAPFELALLKGTKLLHTATFYFRIYPAGLSDDSKISESEMPDFRQAVNAVARAEAAAEEAVEAAESVSGAVENAASSAADALASATEASGYATSAAGSAADAQTYATNAAGSASSAQSSASDASDSAEVAHGYATAAASSESAAYASAQSASQSASTATSAAATASAQASAASGSASAAAGSASSAATQASNAATSASSAATSETNAASYASSAESSAAAASASATNAATSESNAAGSASAASESETNASGSASSAAESALQASGSASAAASSATAAGTAQTAAETARSLAEDSAEDSEAWAVGKRNGTDVPITDETYHNNAKYWAEQAEEAAGGMVTTNRIVDKAVTAAKIDDGAVTYAKLGSDVTSKLSGAMHYIGVTTTALTDGASTNPITIGGESVTAVSGDVAIYDTEEYVFSSTDSKWHEFGSAGSLKALAFKDSASGSYTPQGSVSGTDVTLNTTSVFSITDVGTLPGLTMTVTGENLAFSFSQGTLPTKGAAQTVATGVGSITQPTFSGTQATIIVS